MFVLPVRRASSRLLETVVDALQIERGRANVHAFCDALGITDSQHCPKSFRSLLPCAATQPGAVDLAADIVKHHRVDAALWAALGPFVMRLALGDAAAGDVLRSDAFAAAKRKWLASSGVVNAKLRGEEEAAANAVQAQAVAKSKSATGLKVALVKLERKLSSVHRQALQADCAQVPHSLMALPLWPDLRMMDMRLLRTALLVSRARAQTQRSKQLGLTKSFRQRRMLTCTLNAGRCGATRRAACAAAACQGAGGAAGRRAKQPGGAVSGGGHARNHGRSLRPSRPVRGALRCV